MNCNNIKLYTIIVLCKLLQIFSECFEYSCEECISYNYGDCIKCKNGFTLIDGTCPCHDIHCALCQNGFPNSNSCILCKNDYYSYNENNNKIEINKCKCIIDNCKICANGICLKCEDNYFYDNNSNNCKEKEITSCNDKNCSICFSEKKGACSKCKKNYFLEKGICKKLTNIKYDGVPGLFINNNNLELICGGIECNNKINDFEYKCSNNCFKCNSYKLSLIRNCNNSFYCNLEGCLICFKKDECYECERGYYKLEGICKKCIKGCSYCINENECEYCLSGYELTKEKSCILTQKYDFNISLYNKYKNELNKIDISKENNIKINLSKFTSLSECDQNCEICYDNIGKCIKCKNNFILINNKCKIKNRNLSICWEPNCKTCFSVQSCDVCIVGYLRDKGKCIKIDECYIDDENCSSCDYNNHYICKKCKDNYELINGKCFPYICWNDKHCKNCHNNHICSECDIGYGHYSGSSSTRCEKLKIINSSSSSSKRINPIFLIIGICIGAFIVIILVVCCCLKCKNNDRSYGFNIYNYNGNDGINLARVYIRNIQSENRLNNRITLSQEFKKTKKKETNEEYKLCQYCKRNPGKYKNECGCTLCYEHSKPIKRTKNGRIILVCKNCDKSIINEVEITERCNICFENKEELGHFKCGCSFYVCKNCYIIWKRDNNECPQCKKPI